jgi:DNA polymerase III subunit beta
MKIVIAKEQILLGLQAVQNIVGSRTTLPILSNVLLKAKDGKLELTATDLDVTITCAVNAEVKKEGEVTIPVKKLYGITRELSALEIELEVDDRNACSLRAGSSFYKINGLAAEEYPPLTTFQDEGSVKIPQEKIKTLLKRVSYAVSTDETRYVLNGIFISLKDQKITMVATDGRRLALAHEDVEVVPTSQTDFIVPTKAINELSRLLQTNGELEIRVKENHASFTLKDDKGFSVLIITKLVEGNFPNYRQVIPAESRERISIVREELLLALRRAEIMTSEKANSVKIAFTRNNLAITANTPDVGEAKETIAINYKGADINIAFNPAYMMDPLKALDLDEVFLELTDELSPGVLKINGPFLYVIMPMRMS